MIENDISANVQEFEYQLSYQGIKLDDYLKYTNSKMEDLRNIYKDRAAVAVKTRLVMEAIVKAEGIKADKKSVNARIEEIAKQMGKEVEEVKNNMHPSEMEYIENEVISKNVVEFLKKNNVVAKDAE